MIGHFILRLTLWFLLTANLSIENIIIGILIAIFLPRGYAVRESLEEWLLVLKKIMIAIPVAYIEAFQMIFRPHNREDVTVERVQGHRTPGLIFLDIFLITFTPKTIVQRYRGEGRYEVHWVRRGNEP